MRIALLVTNTDFSSFAAARPDDAEKFATLISEVRPEWDLVPFWVCKDEFPSDIGSFDGVLITGSPASVNDDAPWIRTLTALVDKIIKRQQPLFAACFGHQLVAKTLGAAVIRNPQGWGHGLLEVERTAKAPWSGQQSVLSLYGSHIEQVEHVPEGAERLFRGPGVQVAGFRVGHHVFTVQHHPEMSHDFITDLVEEYADYVGPEVTETARTSLARRADRGAFAEEIARFFEVARG